MQTSRKYRQSELENPAASITSLFSQQPPRSLSEAALKIKELTGIERSTAGIRSFLKRHGFRFLKTGHVPAKADNDKQQQWVKQKLEPAIASAQAAATHLLFMDAAHSTLQPFLCCLWCTARVFIKAAAGRNRINVLGAVNALTKEVSTYINTTYICADCIIAFLKQLKEQYADKPITIVLDNARYQHCNAVEAFAVSLHI